MKASEFCYWLQGYFEISKDDAITKEKVDIIKNHLSMVFVHDLDPKQQKELAASLKISEKDAEELLNKLHRPDGPTMYRC